METGTTKVHIAIEPGRLKENGLVTLQKCSSFGPIGTPLLEDEGILLLAIIYFFPWQHTA